MSQVDVPQLNLPVIHRCDVLIIGASLAGVAAALKLAQSGRRIAIVEARTYPAWELTASLRPWLDDAALYRPDLLDDLVKHCGTQTTSGEIAFNLDCLKTRVEDLLLDAGVKLLYACMPVALLTENDDVTGVVIGSKAGRQVIRCHDVIDTTAEKIITRLQGALYPETQPEAVIAFTLEFDNVSPIEGDTLAAPPSLGLDDDTFHLHRGYRSPQHLLVECRATFPAVANDGFGASQRLAHKSQVAMEATVYLMQQPAFEKAYLAGVSYEVATDEPEANVTHAHGVWRIPFSNDATARIWQGEAAADEVLSGRTSAHDEASAVAESTGSTEQRINAEVRETVASGYSDYQPAPEMTVPVAREVDVLVIGGGTSGATAAYAAAKQGVDTVLAEMNPGLGGTGTFGGVHSYWFGRRVGFAASLSARVNATHQRIAHREANGAIPKWNIEAKSYTLLSDAMNTGVNVLFNAITIGVLVEADRVYGVVVATRYGPVALRAKVVIDASGDADIAAQAGAEVVYGAERDYTTMWYVLAQFTRPGLTRNSFTSTVDVSNVEDYTRAILAGRRRRSDGRMHEHGIYIAPRETRHIRGGVMLTLTDQLLRRCWEDVVNITFSNHDIKGHTTSDWLRVGLIPPNLEIEIPYRALLPNGLENTIVVGKAISATHDALPAIRMQADMENLGGVAGLAAALAVQHGVTARNVPVAELQSQLVSAHVLPDDILTRRLEPRSFTADELNHLIERVATDQPLYQYADMDINAIYEGDVPLVELCCAGYDPAIPLIEARLTEASDEERVKLAVALALMGSETARPILLGELVHRLSNDPLPARKAHVRHTQLPPDQGAMPEECNLLYALGMVADESLLPVWSQLIDQLTTVNEADLRDDMKGIFYYVDAICFGMERLGSLAAAKEIARLQTNPMFRDQHSTSAFQVDYFLERQAYLELVIARTMARCGSVTGYQVLIHYLSDTRALLVRHALKELQALTEQELGREVDVWQQWLEKNQANLVPQPLVHVAEVQSYWRTTILKVEEGVYVTPYS